MKPKTWDSHNINDTTNYISVLLGDAYGLPDAGVQVVQREGAWPVVTGITRPGRAITLEIYVSGSPVNTLKAQLHRWFDPEDETPKKLVVEDDTGGGDRYIYGLCSQLRTISDAYGFHWQATIIPHGDIRLRETTATTDTWTTTDTGLTKTLTNNGTDDAYPVIGITPLAAKASGSGWTYQRFILVDWKAEDAYSGYPVDLGNGGLDTAALAAAGKTTTDCADFRVMVDGVDTPRWLDGAGTTDTAVWVNINFQAKIDHVTARNSFDSDDTTIDPGWEVTSDYPYTDGILQIGSELIIYTYNGGFKFEGCTRGAYGTTAVAHSSSDNEEIKWIQHEVLLLYGNSGATAPSTDNDIYQPLFTLASSSNTVWDYDEFAESPWVRGYRTAAWIPGNNLTGVEYYGANEGGTTDNPYTEIGIHITGDADDDRWGEWRLNNPCGIASVNFSNGEKYTDQISRPWEAYIWPYDRLGRRDDAIYTIVEPTTDATWEAWSYSGSLPSGMVQVGMQLYISAMGIVSSSGDNFYVEAADCAVTLDSTYTPGITIEAESAAYTLDATITNQTTGQAIELDFTMDASQELEVNTDEKTVIYNKDESSQYQALTLTGGARKDWLKLQPGENVIRYDETGATSVRLDFSWNERHYD